MRPLKASWQHLLTEIVKEYKENCRSKIALYTSARHAAAPALKIYAQERRKMAGAGKREAALPTLVCAWDDLTYLSGNLLNSSAG